LQKYRDWFIISAELSQKGEAMTVRFEEISHGRKVYVDEMPFGYIYIDRGFLILPSTILEVLTVSANDLREIADKVDEIKVADREQSRCVNEQGGFV
jgi:ABC-type Zn uptake system ZnuABC Zn-binding protein ZnuA